MVRSNRGTFLGRIWPILVKKVLDLESKLCYSNISMNKLDVVYLVASIASLTASVLLWFNDSQVAGIYVGLWVPSILGFWNIHKMNARDN